MALNQAQDAEHNKIPNLAIDLPSNNPFRNRATSPATPNSLPSPQAFNFDLQNAPAERPRSRNPFLDHTETEQPSLFDSKPAPPSPRRPMAATDSPKRGQLYGNTAVLFNNLALGDNAASSDTSQPESGHRPRRPENVPPTKKFGPSSHQASRSHEEEQRRLRHGGKHGTSETLDIFADPPNSSRSRRPRRNSDSSLVDKGPKLTDEEKKARWQRLADRENRQRLEAYRNGTVPPALGAAKILKPSKRLDIIDQLDVTSIYGTGLVHHDGPFDACNPHRNRKGSKKAPMQAFAKDSANNSIGGSGPVNKNINLEQFHGRGSEGFTDYSKSGAGATLAESYEPYAGASAPIRRGPNVRPGVDRTTSFNPTARVEPVHGDESLGLGTSTFLEGAPAPRAALQRRESESDNAGFGNSGGLGRKKSLVQKIRSINRSDRSGSGPLKSPEYGIRPQSPTNPGDMPKIKEANRNPFFNDYDEQYEKKGARIQIAEEQNRAEDGTSTSRARATSNPRRGPPTSMLERRVTTDGSGGPEEGKTGGGGFLSRVKSLKGGRRAR